MTEAEQEKHVRRPGPHPFDGDQRLMRVLGVEIAELPQIETPLSDRVSERPQRPHFGVRQPAGAQVLFRRLDDFRRLQRDDARLQSAVNRRGARRRHLLGHDDRGHSGKARLSAAKGRRSADGDQPVDEFRVFGAQTLGGFKQPAFVGDRRAGMVDPYLRWAAFCAPGCGAPPASVFALPPWPMKSSRCPVLRFAPSPNGALHLGHAYSALMNERIAAESGGRVLLRMEDLDRTRCKPQFEAAIVDDLAWLGLRFPAPRRQSEHGDDYAAALDRLNAGLVYPCFCSRAEISRASNGQRDPDGAPFCPGTCRALSPAEARDRHARGDKAALRLDMQRALDAAPTRLCWTEYGEGAIPSQHSAAPEVWGDVVLRGRDLAASYHLAVVVDDGLQGVTDVVRGRDLLAATAVHRLLQALLGLREPRYRHHRLVLDQEGAKLSKSRQSMSLAELRAAGFAPGDVRGALGFASGASAGLTVEFG